MTTSAQLAHVRGIGDRILGKIDEILRTGTSTKLTLLEQTEEVQTLKLLTGIWGVGPTLARRLFQQGFRTLEQLRARQHDVLTSAQRVGLKHFDDLKRRIPREEVALIEGVVVAAIRSFGVRTRHGHLAGEDATEAAEDLDGLLGATAGLTPLAASQLAGATTTASLAGAANSTGGLGNKHRRVVDVITCGSYRRGKTSCGDVDILLCDRVGRRDVEGLLLLLTQRLLRDAAVAAATPPDATPVWDVRSPQAPAREPSPDATSAAPWPPTHFAFLDELSRGTRSHTVGEFGCDTWFGVVALPPCPHRATCPCEHDPATGRHFARRLDLKAYATAPFPFAVLYFTGSGYFNRSMRLYAQKKGFHLSDKELRPVVRDKQGKGDAVVEGPRVPCVTERDIFAALGLPYKTPAERDIA